MIRSLTILILFIVHTSFSQENKFVIIGGTAHIGNGTVIENATIIINNGKIKEIGHKDSVNYQRENYEIIDGMGKNIYPTFILPNSSLGLVEIDAVRASRDEKEVGKFNPNVRSQIAYNAESVVVSTVKNNGILMAQVTPRGSGLITGTSSIMKLNGHNWSDATYLKDDGIHINWPEIHHHHRWTHSHDFTASDKDHDEEDEKTKKNDQLIIELKSFFEDAQKYSTDNSSYDLRLESMKGIFEGRQTLFIRANSVNGIKNAILFAENYNIKKYVIVGASDSWRITDFIKKYEVPIVLGRIHSLPRNIDDDIDQKFKTPKILHDAGILFCLDYHGDMERMGSRNLPFLAGTSVSYGLSKENALKLITSNPAKILSIDDRTGTLESGKDANLFISTGDALDVMTNNIEFIFLEGKKVDLENHQTRLYDKYLKSITK